MPRYKFKNNKHSVTMELDEIEYGPSGEEICHLHNCQYPSLKHTALKKDLEEVDGN